jgi:hypothetical protein
MNQLKSLNVSGKTVGDGNDGDEKDDDGEKQREVEKEDGKNMIREGGEEGQEGSNTLKRREVNVPLSLDDVISMGENKDGLLPENRIRIVRPIPEILKHKLHLVLSPFQGFTLPRSPRRPPIMSVDDSMRAHDKFEHDGVPEDRGTSVEPKMEDASSLKINTKTVPEKLYSYDDFKIPAYVVNYKLPSQFEYNKNANSPRSSKGAVSSLLSGSDSYLLPFKLPKSDCRSTELKKEEGTRCFETGEKIAYPIHQEVLSPILVSNKK